MSERVSTNNLIADQDSAIERTLEVTQQSQHVEVVQMSTMNLSPPPFFVVDGAKADDFTAWLKSYTTWATAMELNKKDKVVQAATFEAVLGLEGQKLLSTMKLTEAQQKDPEELRQALRNHFTPKSNRRPDHHSS